MKMTLTGCQAALYQTAHTSFPANVVIIFTLHTYIYLYLLNCKICNHKIPKKEVLPNLLKKSLKLKITS